MTHEACPETEGVKYAGSKLKLLPHILDLVSGRGFRTVLDGFSGTTRVSQAFAQSGYAVTANDVSDLSACFATCYLKSERPDGFYQPLLDDLNALPGQVGWFTEHYGGGLDDRKKPFQRKNTEKLDAIRERLDEMALAEQDRSVLLTALILALDAVDSTLGHFAAYLNRWSARSSDTLTLRLPRRFPTRTQGHTVLKGDIFEAIRNRSFDLAYLDPPYGSNNEKMPPSRVRYGAYYHFWKTVVLNDRPAVFGKANRREDSRDRACFSPFEEFRRNERGRFIAIEAIDMLLREVSADYVLLSYSSGGRATREDLMDALASNGTLVATRAYDYRRNVMASMTSTREWIRADGQNQEYLFLLRK